GGHGRLVTGQDRQDHHLLVQHLVVLELVEQRRRRPFRVLRHEHRRPLDALRRVIPEAGKDLDEGHAHLRHLAEAPARPHPPCGITLNNASAATMGTHPPWKSLARLAPKNARSTRRKSPTRPPARSRDQP